MAQPTPDDLPELDLMETPAKAAAPTAASEAETESWPPDVQELPPALVIATQKQAQGARMRVAGLSVIDRLARQLLKRGHAQVIVASDGVHLPSLPEGALVKLIDAHNIAGALAALRREMDNPVEFPADTVRPRDRDLAVSVRVQNETSRWQAESAIFAEDARLRPAPERLLLGKPASALARQLSTKLTVAPDHVLVAAAALGIVGCLSVLSGSYTGILAGLILATVQVVGTLAARTMARVRYEPGVLSARLPGLEPGIDDALDVFLVFSLSVGIGHHAASDRMVLLGTAAGLLVLAARVAAWVSRLRAPVTTTRPSIRPHTIESVLDAQAVLNALGHRSVFLPLWAALSLFGLHRLIVLHALCLGLAEMVQVALRLRKRQS